MYTYTYTEPHNLGMCLHRLIHFIATGPHSHTPPATHPTPWALSPFLVGVLSWTLHDVRLIRGCCARINHPFISPADLHCPPCCNVKGALQLLSNRHM